MKHRHSIASLKHVPLHHGMFAKDSLDQVFFANQHAGQNSYANSTRRAYPFADRCKGCGAPTDWRDNYCIYCGRQIAAVIRRCACCQGLPEADDLYCIWCGAPLPEPIE